MNTTIILKLSSIRFNMQIIRFNNKLLTLILQSFNNITFFRLKNTNQLSYHKLLYHVCHNFSLLHK